MRKRAPTAVNQKKMRPQPNETERARLAELACKVDYAGNPAHKRHPGDFGLTPPSGARQGAMLCDEAEVFVRAKALELLREGIRCGMVSVQERNGWPQNVWAVADNGTPLEAMLENRETGTYHAYPMFPHDPLRGDVVKRWKGR